MIDQKTIQKVKEVNSDLNDEELLNWAMNQLFRAARTMELLDLGSKRGSEVYVVGCDIAAEAILERLKKTETGIELIRNTNIKLLD